MALFDIWTKILSILTGMLKWIPIVTAYVSGRRSVINETNEKVVDIRGRQTKAALDKPDRDAVIDSLRDAKDDRW